MSERVRAVAARWQKLIWSVPFNGLAIAGGGIATDRILGDPAFAAQVRPLMEEIASAARPHRRLAISASFSRVYSSWISPGRLAESSIDVLAAASAAVLSPIFARISPFR